MALSSNVLINTKSIIPLVINYRKRGNEKSYNPKLVKSSLSKITSSNLDRLEEINEVLNLIHKESPFENYDFTNITEMIGDYDTDEHFECLYEIVTSKLNLSLNERSNLDFHDKNFESNLYSILLARKKKKKLPNCPFYQIHLEKLLFKWLIYMEKNFMDNDPKVERSVSCNLFDSMNKLNIKYSKFQVYHKSDSRSIPFSKSFQELLKVEFFQNPFLFSIFASAVEYFYLYRNGKLMTCQDLLRGFFGSRYNNNPLLKCLIVMFDPQGRMRKCIMESDGIGNLPIISQSTQIIYQEYFENLGFKGPSNLVFGNSNYSDISTFEFFLSHDRRFQIQSRCDLFSLMEKFENWKVLSEESIEKTIEFQLANGITIWDPKIFKQYIKDDLDCFHSLHSYDSELYKKSLEMFKENENETSLISQFIQLFH